MQMLLLLLLLWSTAVVFVVVSEDMVVVVVAGECRFQMVAGFHRGFVCPLTEAGINSIPMNSSAIRLVSVQTTRQSKLNLTLPPLPSLRTLEVDVTHRGTLSPNGPFVHLPRLTRLQLLHSASSADDFRFILSAGIFEGILDLRQLILPDLGIEELPVGVFNGLENLRILELNHNRLSSIRNGTFSHCCRLVSFLTLARNRIADLTLVSWIGLPALRTLDLSSNLLSTLPERSFEGLGSLNSVDLTRNRIHSIETSAFAGLDSLRELILNDNQLRVESDLRVSQGQVSSSAGEGGLRRSSFLGLSSLETLELKGNVITRVNRSLFSELRSLIRLDLSQNNLEFLSPEYLEDLSNLTDLYLSGNRLKTLDRRFIQLLNRLLNLDLSLNPWNCDCQLLWLAEWLKNSSVEGRNSRLEITGRNEITCSQPVAGIGLMLAFQETNVDCVENYASTGDDERHFTNTQNTKTQKTADVITTEMTSLSAMMTQTGSSSGTLLSSITEDFDSFGNFLTTKIIKIEKLKTVETLLEPITTKLKALDLLLLTTISKIDNLDRLLTTTIATIETTDSDVRADNAVASDNCQNYATTKTEGALGFCLTLVFIVFEYLR